MKARMIKLGMILVLSVLLGACSSLKQVTTSELNKPLPFDQAVQMNSDHLLSAIQNNQGPLARFVPAKVVVDPFVDAYSLEEVASSQQITQSLIQTARSKYRSTVQVLSRNSLPDSHYIIQGYLYLDSHPSTKQRLYRIQSVAKHIRTGKVVGISSIWVSSNNIKYQRTPEYRDRPVYPSRSKKTYKQRVDQIKQPQSAPVLWKQLTIKSLLNDAGKAYAVGNYRQALVLYKKAEKMGKWEELRTYAGLYLSHLRLGNTTEAETAFNQLIKLNLQKNNALTVKLLFAVDSTNFVGDQFLRQQYEVWLKNIAHHFVGSKQCFSIVGHSSKSGSSSYNQQLSHSRAKKIQSLMSHYVGDVAQHSRVIGKGFAENIIGLGTDDHRDALDRRVEFIRGGC